MNWKRSTYCTSGSCVEVTFTRSSYCGSSACVEVGTQSDSVYVRDSKDPGTVLEFDRAEWDAFLAGAKAGEFDG